MAGRVTAYLAGVQERLRTAERERAVAVARAVEERKRRRLAIALAASLLALTGAVAGGWAWIVRDRAARAVAAARTLNEAITEARVERERGRSGPAEDLAHWVKAVAACRRAEPVLAEGEADPAARARIRADLDEVRSEAARADALVESARADRRMSERLGELWLKIGERLDRPWFDPRHGAGVPRVLDRHPGPGPGRGGPADRRSADSRRAGRLARQLGLQPAATRRQRRGPSLPPGRRGRRPRSPADSDPPGPRRTRPAGAASPGRCDRPRHRLGPDRAVSRRRPRAVGGGRGAARLPKAIQRRHPDDHWINNDLAMVLLDYTKDPPLAEVIRYATAAVAIRPKIPYARGYLVRALKASGRPEEAIAEYRDFLRIDPGNPTAHYNLGCLLFDSGKTEGGDRRVRRGHPVGPCVPRGPLQPGTVPADTKALRRVPGRVPARRTS